jgi:hypothetical protein
MTLRVGEMWGLDRFFSKRQTSERTIAETSQEDISHCLPIVTRIQRALAPHRGSLDSIGGFVGERRFIIGLPPKGGLRNPPSIPTRMYVMFTLAYGTALEYEKSTSASAGPKTIGTLYKYRKRVAANLSTNEFNTTFFS